MGINPEKEKIVLINSSRRCDFLSIDKWIAELLKFVPFHDLSRLGRIDIYDGG